jgi:hypothetical protein
MTPTSPAVIREAQYPADWWAKITPEGLILFASPNSAPVFGMPPDRMHAFSMVDYIQKDQRPIFVARLQELTAEPADPSQSTSASATSSSSSNSNTTANLVSSCVDEKGPYMNINILTSYSQQSIPAVIVLHPSPPTRSTTIGKFLFCRVSVDPLTASQLGIPVSPSASSMTADMEMNLYGNVGPGKKSGLQFELNQLKMNNKKILEELEALSSSGNKDKVSDSFHQRIYVFLVCFCRS